MAKYLDSNGLLYFWQKLRLTFVSDISWDSTNKKLVKKKKTGTSGAEESTDLVTFATVATTGSYNDLSNTPTIPTLKNVFGKVKVGSTTIEADTTQDTLELAAGDNVTLTPDTTNDKVTIAATDTTYESKSASSGGTAVSLCTTGEKYTWNNKSDFSGSYSDLSNKPTLGTAAAANTASTVQSGSTALPTGDAVAAYVASAVSGGAAFQGTVNDNTTIASSNYVAGWYWVVGTAGTYVGQACEVGDMVYAINNKSSAYSASDFTVIQNNLEIISNGDIDTILAA